MHVSAQLGSSDLSRNSKAVPQNCYWSAGRPYLGANIVAAWYSRCRAPRDRLPPGTPSLRHRAGTTPYHSVTHQSSRRSSCCSRIETVMCTPVLALPSGSGTAQETPLTCRMKGYTCPAQSILTAQRRFTRPVFRTTIGPVALRRRVSSRIRRARRELVLPRAAPGTTASVT
jgi:hypothetical protein